ncbi:hypothetical protein DFH06DRAFT_238542 [Mycena polygramma]|nr:hypothetical protein DFH06DRAFT_238542 [Mycena polygramma]
MSAYAPRDIYRSSIMADTNLPRPLSVRDEARRLASYLPWHWQSAYYPIESPEPAVKVYQRTIKKLARSTQTNGSGLLQDVTNQRIIFAQKRALKSRSPSAPEITQLQKQLGTKRGPRAASLPGAGGRPEAGGKPSSPGCVDGDVDVFGTPTRPSDPPTASSSASPPEFADLLPLSCPQVTNASTPDPEFADLMLLIDVVAVADYLPHKAAPPRHSI